MVFVWAPIVHHLINWHNFLWELKNQYPTSSMAPNASGHAISPSGSKYSKKHSIVQLLLTSTWYRYWLNSSLLTLMTFYILKVNGIAFQPCYIGTPVFKCKTCIKGLKLWYLSFRENFWMSFYLKGIHVYHVWWNSLDTVCRVFHKYCSLCGSYLIICTVRSEVYQYLSIIRSTNKYLVPESP